MMKRVLLPPGDVESMTSVYEVLRYSGEKYGSAPAYCQLEEDGSETVISFIDFRKRVDSLRSAVIKQGLRGCHFALIGENGIEWLSAYIAVTSGIGVCVPIDRDLPDETLIYQISHADVDAVFISKRYLKRLDVILSGCPSVKTVVVMRGDAKDFKREGTEIVSYSQFIESGENEEVSVTIDPDELCAIFFTSGTTGPNRGVMLSNRNIMGTVRGCNRLYGHTDTCLSVLPVNHAYELNGNLILGIYDGTYVFINNEMRYFLKNIQRFRPEMSCMVPMMMDALVQRTRAKIRKSGKKKTFERTVRISNRLRKLHIDMRSRLFRDVIEDFGGRLRLIVCGGAPINPDSADFLDAVGITILNGYGITECAPVVSFNTIYSEKRSSVGYVLPTVEVRIAEKNESGNGEIEVRGDNVMLGYYRDPKRTAEVFTEDGWFKTGDLGYMDDDGFLYLSGRIKNLIILSNGENVCPEEIERQMEKQVSHIRECVVDRNRAQNGLYAYIHPDMDFFRQMKMTDAKEIKAFMKEDMARFNAMNPGYLKISDYEIRCEEFEKNNTHKILRDKVISQ